MFTKTMLALTAALFVAASFAPVAEAQRAPKQQKQAVQPFTEAERLWFQIPEGPERLP